MTEGLRISRVRFAPAPVGSAVLGYASCSIGDLGRLDGLAVRCTAPGEFSLSFPSRRDRSGRRHSYFRPATRATHLAIEQGVLDALRARGVLQPPLRGALSGSMEVPTGGGRKPGEIQPGRALRFVRANQLQRDRGLLGWAHLEDGDRGPVTLRVLRSDDGRYVAEFSNPSGDPTGGGGKPGEFEAQVIAELQARGLLP